MLTRSLAIMAQPLKDVSVDVSDKEPHKDLCGSCSNRFYANQQYLKCSAGCNRRFHCKCIDVRAEDYNVLMETGFSTYKCTSCIRRSSKPNESGDEEDSASVEKTPAVPSIVNGESLSSEVVHMFTTILNKLDLLVTEVKCLKAENNSLRSELSQIRKCLPSSRPMQAGPRMPYAAVMSANASAAPPTTNASGTLDRQSSSAWTAPDIGNHKTDLNYDTATSVACASTVVGRAGQPGLRVNSPMNVTEDGFVPWKSRRQAKASSGTSKNCKVKSVPRKALSKALFVSRLDPDTSVTEVLDIIKPVLKAKIASCAKLRTKYTSYASFHISVEDETFEALNNPEVWPEGCLFHQFFGKLDASRVSESIDQNGSVEEHN